MRTEVASCEPLSPVEGPALSPVEGSALSAVEQAASSPRHAFTLVEMLVVMAVIVLAITMAIPAIRFLTGSRSQESATNTISGMLGFARNDAMALQDYRGVLFMLDDDDRVKCYEVQKSTDPYSLTDMPGVLYLDLAGATYPPPVNPALPPPTNYNDRNMVSLPPGIRVWLLNDNDRLAPMYPGFSYLGMNFMTDFAAGPVRTDVRVGGVILYGPDGKLVARRYGFRFVTHQPTTGNPLPTSLSQLFASDLTSNFTTQMWPGGAGPNSTKVLNSSIGLAMCDKQEVQTNLDGLGWQSSMDENDPSLNADKTSVLGMSHWLDNNTTPSFVNRYSGTLMQAE